MNTRFLYWHLVILIIVGIFGQRIATAQNTPPPVEWNFSTPSLSPNFAGDDNWANAIIQATDGNIIAVGFSDLDEGTGDDWRRYPAIFKYNPGQRLMVWETIPDHVEGNTIEPAKVGGFNDVFEFINDDGIPLLFAAGHVKRDNSSEHPAIGMFNRSTGQIADYHDLAPNARIYSLAPVFTGPTLTAVYGCGNVNTVDGPRAAIFKMTPEGQLDTGFGTGGYVTYTYANVKTVFRDIISDTDGNFVAVGHSKTSPDCDVYIVKVAPDGTLLEEEVLTESEVEGEFVYTDLNQSTEITHCDGIPQENDNETGFCVQQMPDGNYAVLCRFDFIDIVPDSQMSCYNYFHEQYFDADIALLKLSSDFDVLYGLDAGRSIGIDYYNPMVKQGDVLYILAAAHITTPQPEVWGSIICVQDMPLSETFAPRWRRDFKGINHEYCPFGICLARDGGIVTSGNNALNGDDYELIKLANPCLVNTTYTTPNNVTISTTVTWNTSRTVRRTIRIANGGHLTIQNATIKFAHSYLTNDWYKLADGSGFPCKIVVEPGGRLTLDNCLLTGMNTCGIQWAWEGIELRGNPNLSGSSANQGQIYMKNNARIEYAIDGITAGQIAYNQHGRHYGTGAGGGGQVKASNPVGNTISHFHNCRRSAWFAPYNGSSSIGQVYFRYTNFVSDASFPSADYVDTEGNGYGPNFQLGSWDRDRISVQNCAFRSLDDWPETAVHRGIGIVLADARISISGTVFERLHTGVQVSNPVDITERADIVNSQFLSIRNGVKTLAGSLHRVKNSGFSDIPDQISSTMPSFAAKFDGSTKLSLDNDTLSTDQNGCYGFVISAAQMDASLVKGNYATGLYAAVQTQQNNSGLQIRCNRFQDNYFALSINPESPGSGLLPHQGDCGSDQYQAGNTFSSTCDDPGSHIISTVPFEYRYRNGYAGEEPTCIDGPVTVVDCKTINPYTCSSTFPCDPCHSTELVSLIAKEKNAWQKQLLQNELLRVYLDDDQIQAALDLIRDAYPDNPMFYVAALIEYSDYNLAAQTLSGIPANTPTLAYFHTLYNILIGLGQSKRTVKDLTPAEESRLEQIAQSDTEARYQAQAILELKNEVEYDRHIEVWSRGSKSTRTEETTPLPALKLTPNPAFEQVRLDMDGSTPIQSAQIFDAKGALVLEQVLNGVQSAQLDVATLVDGLYFVKVLTARGIYTAKLVVAHR